MDYKKKYKKALEELKQCDRYDIEPAKTILKIFPELEESDYVIKQRLIHLLGYFRSRGIDHDLCDRILNWLEKQGDYNRLVEEMKERKELLSKEKEKAISTNDKLSLGGRIAILEELLAFTKEKQGEKNPTDKVEPKFKVGDWVANSSFLRSPLKIVDVSDIEYRIEDIEGNSGVSKIDYLDRNYHLWTIQDAKDGDVLAIENEYFLFKQKKDTSSSVYISHCFADSAGAFRVTNGRDCGEFLSIENGIKVCPATKEQRNLLFSKMKEAGYEWDANKKELNKIEKNPAWSEEDEVRLDEAIQMVEANGTWVRSEDAVKLVSDWLKALKDRVGCEVNCTTKKEWSEEDEGNLLDVKCVIDEVWHNQDVREEIGHSGEELESLWHWLDNIWQRVEYPQNNWKPSEEQMRVLQTAIRDYGVSHEKSIFESLYNDLKKL